MIKDNDSVSKYHYKVYQAEAIKWWRCLSINQQRGLEKKHGAFGQASSIEIARIYDLESRKDPDLLKNAKQR